eukprot:g30763.t1
MALEVRALFGRRREDPGGRRSSEEPDQGRLRQDISSLRSLSSGNSQLYQLSARWGFLAHFRLEPTPSRAAHIRKKGSHLFAGDAQHD